MNLLEKTYRGATNQLAYGYMDHQRTISKKLAVSGETAGMSRKKKRIQGRLVQVDENLGSLNEQSMEFLNKEEILQIRQKLSDLNFGEFVMMFHNPDHPTTKNKSITLNQAMRQFNDMNVINNMNKSKQKEERNAFQKAFLNLPSFLGEKEKKYFQEQKKKFMEDGLQNKLEEEKIKELAQVEKMEELEEQFYQLKK